MINTIHIDNTFPICWVDKYDANGNLYFELLWADEIRELAKTRRVVLNLYSETGSMAAAFSESDEYVVLTLDLEHGYDMLRENPLGFKEDLEEWCGITQIDGIIGNAPCTDFAGSGARWWADKDAGKGFTDEYEKDHCYAKSTTDLHVTMAELVLLYVDFLEPRFWIVENPVGRINSLVPAVEQYGKPLWVNPNEYAGWANVDTEELNELDRIRAKDGVDVTTEEARLIVICNAYTKKTGLWGCFNRDLVKKEIEPVKGNTFGSPLMRFGGKSQKTKASRSKTPLGLSRAIFEANK